MTHRSGKARTQEAFQNLRTAIQATPYPEYEWFELFIRLAAEDDTPLSDASKLQQIDAIHQQRGVLGGSGDDR